MKLFKYTYKYLFLVLAMMLGFTSCVVDDIEQPEDPLYPDIPIDEYNLSFNINLQSLQTRDGIILGNNFEDYEDYIDASQTYILFFTADDDKDDKDDKGNKLIKLFSKNDLSLLPVRGLEDESVKKWVVKIPISKLEDGEAFATQLRKAPFKIAILANWGNQPPAIKQATYSKESNSYTLYGDDIDVLHHQTDSGDPYSDGSDDDDSDEQGAKESVYGFLYSDYKSSGKYLGYYTNWVKNNNPNYNSKDKARAWIRNNWDPSISKNHTDAKDNDGGVYQLGTRFTDLWFLWNFGGNASDNAVPYGTSDKNYTMKTYSKGAWENRTGLKLRTWIESSIKAGYLIDYEQNRTGNDADRNYLGYKQISQESTTQINKAIAVKNVDGSGNYYYGIKLPRLKDKGGSTNYQRVGPEDEGVLTFTARATGTLLITGKHAGNNSGTVSGDAKIVAQIGYSDSSKEEFNFEYTKGIYTIAKKISITGDEQPIYLFNGSTNSNENKLSNWVEIYQIEYIQDEYLYNTDRSGVVPSTEQPIAMYGIQRFERLDGHWIKGTSFDLSNTNNGGPTSYNPHYKDIMLLRSVAKIELQIPSSLKPDFVYLRSVNRKARWEPVDISSNTSEIWKDYTENSLSHPSTCEWFTIKQQQNFFTNNATIDPTTQLANYRKKLAWYYGAWSKEGKVNGQEIDNNSKKLEFPKLMNAVIERSDFVEFIKAPSVDQFYDRYVLYVGEKYVDDPNDVGNTEDANKGMEASRPKICHIEFRVGDNVSHTNLDDNNCVRIYLIEGGMKKEVSIPDFRKDPESGEYNDWEHAYEQNLEVLENHWPIMRNHVYSFKVIDVNNLMPLVDLKVLPWKMVEDQNNYDW